MSNTDKTSQLNRKHLFTAVRDLPVDEEKNKLLGDNLPVTHNRHGKKPFMKLKERSHNKKSRGNVHRQLRLAAKFDDHEALDFIPVKEEARGSYIGI